MGALAAWCGLIAVSLVGNVVADPPQIPRSWTPAAPQTPLPDSTAMWRSADRRCSFAVVSASEKDSRGLDRERLTAALVDQVGAAGVEIGAPGRGGRMALKREGVAGQATLAGGGDNDARAWQLRACFYREKDANVCEIHCAKLLAPTR